MTWKRPDYSWIAKLKVGDKVFVQFSGFGSEMTLKTVTRITKTQILLGSREERYRIEDGTEVGRRDRWHRWRMIEATPELMDLHLRKLTAYEIAKFTHKELIKVPMDVLTTFIDAVTAANKDHKNGKEDVRGSDGGSIGGRASGGSGNMGQGAGTGESHPESSPGENHQEEAAQTTTTATGMVSDALGQNTSRCRTPGG